MALESDRCICLRKFEYSETSQILSLFTRQHGLIRAIAKGAHRKTKAGAGRFDGGIDLLDVGEAVFTADPARELGTLTEWKLQEGHLALRRDLRALYLGLYAAELVSMLIEEHDPHVDLFDRIQRTLPELATAAREEAFLSFELDLLQETGYMPEFSNCGTCGSALAERAAAFFAPSRGGVVCRNCEATIPDRIEVDLRLLRLAQGILRLPRADGTPLRLPRLTRHQTNPLNYLIAEHVEHTLGHRLRMPRYLNNSPARALAAGRT